MNKMKPILFSTEMVRAIQDLRKTQTRRVIKDKDITNWFDIDVDGTVIAYIDQATGDSYPPTHRAKYQPGDILWVRESWCENRGKYFYKADNICNGCTEDGICLPEGVAKHITCELCEDRDGYIKWRSPMFMPREAARIFLRVTNVRVERLREITAEDAKAEGIVWEPGTGWTCDKEKGITDAYRSLFKDLWDSLNAKRGYGWEANPWVWVYEFERVEGLR